MPRITFDEIFIRSALTLAERSTCSRLQVGSILVSLDNKKVLAMGYNGNCSGFKNACDTDKEGNCGCIHSEMNLVANNDTSRYIKSKLYVSHLPCVACAKLLIQMGGIQEVYYKNDYRIQDSLELFKQANIQVFKC